MEMIHQLHIDLLDQHRKIQGNNGIKILFNGSVLKRLHENLAAVYGRVLLLINVSNHSVSLLPSIRKK